ncbi:MAG: oxidoreductase [Candidatus Saccharibacteria bacterium]|nr:oxidoreductase [Candidatus Saccharibacteria bacterium]
MKQVSLQLQRLGDALDSSLDRLTTYRLVLYLLCLYLLAAVALSLGHQIGFSAVDIIGSFVWLLAISRLSNWLFAKLFKVPYNHESDLITALILSLILTPAGTLHDYLILGAAAVVAQLSKYVLSVRGRHIFNPAALGAFVSGVVFHSYASWWIGTRAVAPLLIIGAVLILRKMKRFQMAGLFILIALAYLIFHAPAGSLSQFIQIGLLSSPLIFFASIMLTEPLTSPTKFRSSLYYAALVGILYAIIALRFSPEEALLAGNILVFILNPNRSLLLNFVRQQKEAEGIYSYHFHAPKKLNFKPGQYMEWTLPGVHLDARGNRRYLTIASSPTEESIMFTIKMPVRPSSFKSSLSKLKHGEVVLAAQLAGSFTLPKDPAAKLAFIAGGVGITPFHSMARYLIDKQEQRDINLFYFVNSPAEIAYQKAFDLAEGVGFKNYYVVRDAPENWTGLSGLASKELFRKNTPDFDKRMFYISGPQGFVAAVHQMLLELGVAPDKIITDFFPGYNS